MYRIFGNRNKQKLVYGKYEIAGKCVRFVAGYGVWVIHSMPQTFSIELIELNSIERNVSVIHCVSILIFIDFDLYNFICIGVKLIVLLCCAVLCVCLCIDDYLKQTVVNSSVTYHWVNLEFAIAELFIDKMVLVISFPLSTQSQHSPTNLYTYSHV